MHKVVESRVGRGVADQAGGDQAGGGGRARQGVGQFADGRAVDRQHDPPAGPGHAQPVGLPAGANGVVVSGAEHRLQPVVVNAEDDPDAGVAADGQHVGAIEAAVHGEQQPVEVARLPGPARIDGRLVIEAGAARRADQPDEARPRHQQAILTVAQFGHQPVALAGEPAAGGGEVVIEVAATAGGDKGQEQAGRRGRWRVGRPARRGQRRHSQNERQYQYNDSQSHGRIHPHLLV